MTDQPGKTPPDDERDDDDELDDEEQVHIEVIENLVQKIEGGNRPTDSDMLELRIAEARVLLDLVGVMASIAGDIKQIKLLLRGKKKDKE